MQLGPDYLVKKITKTLLQNNFYSLVNTKNTTNMNVVLKCLAITSQMVEVLSAYKYSKIFLHFLAYTTILL